ncbi:MAG: penicillin-binding protein 2 [Firmicutes bacterium]|nr:penicillin-binding protein 2 [Bacillota bacterium]
MSDDELKVRLKTMSAVLVLLFGLLVTRLWYLQMIKGEQYAALADGNRIRVVPIRAPRGTILDRFERPIVSNRFSYTVSIVPLGLPTDDSKSEVLSLLGRLIGMSADEIERILDEENGPYPYEPVRLKRDVSPEVVIALEEQRIDLPGVLVEEEWTREYIYEDLASQTLGYLGAVDKEDLKKGYRPTDLIGKTGLEKAYEEFLRGGDGQRRVEVNALSKPLRELSTIDPVPGHDLYLTLDLDLQMATEKAMRERLDLLNKSAPRVGAGAVVVLDPRTGEILALVSHPGYDPNMFLSGERSRYYMQILANPHRPLLHRALLDYPPGSVFKPFTGLAALDTGALKPDEEYNATGYGKYGKMDWTLRARPRQQPAGRVTIVGALARSANDFFWNIALRPATGGVDGIARMARAFGFGQPTGLRISPTERSGLIPDKEWKRRTYRQPWYEAETMDVAIGQGFVTATPLQIAVAYMGLANRGEIYRPYLVKRVMTPEGQVVLDVTPQLARRVKTDAANWEAVVEGLKAVTQWPNGTAASAFRTAPYDPAGKTGSAQTAAGQPAHAWFAGFAPADDPEIVVVVFVEFGEGGASAAAPIARQIMDAYFDMKAERAVKSSE